MKVNIVLAHELEVDWLTLVNRISSINYYIIIRDFGDCSLCSKIVIYLVESSLVWSHSFIMEIV